jgi:hypothetical protein
MKDILDVIQAENRELTEEELDALYIYLNMYFEEMPLEQQNFWLEVLKTVDKNFYEDQDSGTD